MERFPSRMNSRLVYCFAILLLCKWFSSCPTVMTLIKLTMQVIYANYLPFMNEYMLYQSTQQAYIKHYSAPGMVLDLRWMTQMCSVFSQSLPYPVLTVEHIMKCQANLNSRSQLITVSNSILEVSLYILVVVDYWLTIKSMQSLKSNKACGWPSALL